MVPKDYSTRQEKVMLDRGSDSLHTASPTQAQGDMGQSARALSEGFNPFCFTSALPGCDGSDKPFTLLGLNFLIKNTGMWDFPGGPAVETPHFQCKV